MAIPTTFLEDVERQESRGGVTCVPRRDINRNPNEFLQEFCLEIIVNFKKKKQSGRKSRFQRLLSSQVKRDQHSNINKDPKCVWYISNSLVTLRLQYTHSVTDKGPRFKSSTLESRLCVISRHKVAAKPDGKTDVAGQV